MINLFGELSGMEALCHLILVNEFETATISIPDPYELSSVINLFMHTKKNPKISVELLNRNTIYKV